jgi:RHH-type proline utilization regulon transcriptional repressor/proline dehydrogenase/delta 1-pyrroline-5-carboxylate dehydrogenase
MDFGLMNTSEQGQLIEKAVALARNLQERATQLQTPQERRQQAELDRMLQNPRDKATLVQLTDQAFRADSARRAVNQFTHILDVQGVPRFFSPIERTLLKGFQSFGSYLPGVAVPLVKGRMHHETANVILPAESDLLSEHLRRRREQGVRMNVNFLGEAILSEAEARRRLEQYLEAIQLPETEVFSVKISTLNSQISSLAREHTVSVLCERLEMLYRTAARAVFVRADGARVPKFVYLDMEEYRDLSLTAEAFMRTLDRPGLREVRAGIVLQAYIPDSFRAQKEINAWARRRVAEGGAPITLRIVKGANMEMERVEASTKGWPQAPFKTKIETDANYKRMLNEAMQPANLAAVKIGVASHNLFDLAYGLALAEAGNAFDSVQFEMLEGMANHQRRALFEQTKNLLLYSPVCHKKDFTHAIGYLIRRLDENTGPENFLRHAFKLSVGSPEWQTLERGFLDSIGRIATLSDAPRRTQNRAAPPSLSHPTARGWQHFENEPDTDWSLPHHSLWAQEIIARWVSRHGDRAMEIPLVIDGQLIFENRSCADCLDPSRPGFVLGHFRRATDGDIDHAVACAAADEDGWRNLSYEERQTVLRRVAQEMRIARGDLMGAALANGGKTLAESDPEVSEAVDFLEFYAECARYFSDLPGLESSGRGVVVVVPPWNFPIAIPCGGVAAALAAGNTVILKPASATVLIAYELCCCFWRAGISKKTLQFTPAPGNQQGRRLAQHAQVSAVILTGGTATARSMLRDKPDLHLIAETGGKNGTIVTALSDRDLAIKNILHSAFSHAGQKCSATSLLLLEAEIYDDPDFKRALCEAAASITVGSAWELKTKMGPLIQPPRDDLETALKTLEAGESWALMPAQVEGFPHLWRPGIKWGVQRESYTHRTEFFGPLLGVMRFEKLSEAIAMVNETGYGLTSGLESLDDREQQEWKTTIRAGNLYLNRVTTGAIVLRQPFGGMGKSTFGPGIKAGGPNYVAQFMNFAETARPEGDEEPADALLKNFRKQLIDRQEEVGAGSADDVRHVVAAIGSYSKYFREEFGQAHDHFRLVGQDNFRRYLPIRELRVRVHAADSSFQIFARVAAARTVGCRITVSSAPDAPPKVIALLHEFTESWAAAIEFVEETEEQLAAAILAGQIDRIRYAATGLASEPVRRAAAEHCVYLVESPVLMHGRIELLWYVEEQSISFDYHRYGNLGNRAEETRAEIL